MRERAFFPSCFGVGESVMAGCDRVVLGESIGDCPVTSLHRPLGR